MKMRKLRVLTYGVTVLVCIWGIGANVARGQVKSQDPRIALVDNCDPNTFMGLCVVLPRPGDTTFAEFLDLLFSSSIDNGRVFVGHPAWRFEPGYVSIRAGQTVRVTNSGGEDHTFTEVTQFGGGSITFLNGPDAQLAPGCPADPNNLVVVAQGNTVQVKGLSSGPHKFMCCIHPWMRAVIDVEE
jgi:plastocyanin